MNKRINVTESSMPSFEEYCEEIKSIWETKHLTNMGQIHNKLKDKLKDYLKVNNIELFVNGHLALYVALKAMKITGEIITTPFTFASTTNAIIQAGCEPVFCDVKDDYTIDESKIEALITEKTAAILGVHVYGNICNVEAIEQIAKKHNLKVIYDAAHAFGVEYKGIGIGNFGDISMYSFHATKVFHTIEGGALAFNDLALLKNITLQRNFGVNGEELEVFGTNAKMNEFQAAMGICNLWHIDEEIALRKAVFERYVDNLQNVNGIVLMTNNDSVKRNYAYFPIIVESEIYGKNRDELCEKLKEKNIFSRKYFYPLVSENKEFQKDLTVTTPNAKYFSRNVLCLPMYSKLALSDVDFICNLIKER